VHPAVRAKSYEALRHCRTRQSQTPGLVDDDFIQRTTVVPVALTDKNSEEHTLVALIVVPVTAALIAGFGFKTEQFMLSGVQQTASVAAMFVFAILSRDISASWIGR